jgi:hypothetical protein
MSVYVPFKNVMEQIASCKTNCHSAQQEYSSLLQHTEFHNSMLIYTDLIQSTSVDGCGKTTNAVGCIGSISTLMLCGHSIFGFGNAAPYNIIT